MNEKAFVPPRLNRLLRALKVLRGIGVDCFSPALRSNLLFPPPAPGRGLDVFVPPPCTMYVGGQSQTWSSTLTTLTNSKQGAGFFSFSDVAPLMHGSVISTRSKSHIFCTCVFRCAKYGTAATYTALLYARGGRCVGAPEDSRRLPVRRRRKKGRRRRENPKAEKGAREGAMGACRRVFLFLARPCHR